MCSMKQAIVALTASSFLCAGLASAQSTQSTPATTQQKPATTAPPAPVAGKATLGVAVIEMDAVIAGWSVTKDLLKKTVVNDRNEKIGSISDVIITPNPDAKLPSASFAIIGVGGFLGLGKHDVAIPMEQLRLQDGKLVLPGASKDALKLLPQFEYRRK
jgi:sporulation protein YlmC with PRC-barrel domain